MKECGTLLFDVSDTPRAGPLPEVICPKCGGKMTSQERLVDIYDGTIFFAAKYESFWLCGCGHEREWCEAIQNSQRL